MDKVSFDYIYNSIASGNVVNGVRLNNLAANSVWLSKRVVFKHKGHTLAGVLRNSRDGLFKIEFKDKFYRKVMVALPKEDIMFDVCAEHELINFPINEHYGEELEKKYTIEDIVACVENWGMCRVEAPYIEAFLSSRNSG